jgi:dienelactone hydrolase
MRTVVLFLGLLILAGNANAQERVEIPSGNGKPLFGYIFKPDGPGPFPAIVALHGCGGLGGSKSPVGQRHTDWGRQLSAKGYIVIFPDSYGSRDLGPQCLVKDRTIRPGRERVLDALLTKVWLQKLPDVIPNRVSLLGWSNGGSSVLWSVAVDRKPKDDTPDFNAAVAFYPGCRVMAQSAERRAWLNRLPLLILIGESDTWTPAEPCKQLVASAKAAGSQVDIIIYPNAVHVFDHPDQKPTKRTGLAFTGDDSGEAMVGTDRAAREDALQRVPTFLNR